MRTLRDYLSTNLDLVIVGINPSEFSADCGHYYARPTNQFWSLLSASGLVAENLKCDDDCRILEFGLGLTDVVKRPTPSANELTRQDYRREGPAFLDKIRKYRPRMVAFNGKTGYQNFRRAVGYGSGGPIRLGIQREPLEGAEVFVLPSTSPANARLSREQKLAYFRALAERVHAQSKGIE
jgi:double-stranded uracil-DNA glycosylase